MIRTQCSLFASSAAALALAALACLASGVSAATISYADVGPVGTGVSFTDISESSGTDAVPLYGSPAGFPTGLDFNPMSFTAQAVGGGSDLTDGQLNFTVNVPNDRAINLLSLYEAGDYTLTGTGTAATQVVAGAILRATITEINGVAVAPINVTPFNASVSANLPANGGVVQPWSLGVSLNVASALGPGQFATQVDVVINNQLIAASEPASLAFIAKKDFQITLDDGPGNIIPEPGTFALAGLALCGLSLLRRRHA